MKRYLLIVIALLSLTLFNRGNAQIAGVPDKWVPMTPLDTGVVFATAFGSGNAAVVVGGDTSDFYGVYTRYSKQAWLFLGGTWTRVADFPGKARIGAVGMVINGKGYYGLGEDSSNYIDTLHGSPDIIYYKRGYLKDWWEYDPNADTWTQKADFPDKPRAYASAISLGGYGYVGLGVDTIVQYDPIQMKDVSISNFPKSFWRYDPSGNSWTQMSDFPGQGRAGAYVMRVDSAIVDINGNVTFKPMIFAGLGTNPTITGIGAKPFYNDWYAFDPSSGDWITKKSFPSTGRAYGSTINFSFLGYIVCGYDSRWLREFWEYNGTGDSWQRFPDYGDSSRHATVGFTLGRYGFVGAGFRPNSETLSSFQVWEIDTNTIRINSPLPDTICASDTISINWATGATFSGGNKAYIQISNSEGNFEWPVTSSSLIDSLPTTLQAGTHPVVVIPSNSIEGRYKVRVISSNPAILGTASKEIFVRSRPQFSYDTEFHPLVDTACFNSPFMIPIPVNGSTDTSGELALQWFLNGDSLFADTTFSGVNSDTLFIKQIRYIDSGVYTLVAQGPCYSATSLPFHVTVDSIPPPTIDSIFQVGIIGDTAITDSIFLCESTPVTLRISADGKHLNFQWWKNDDTLSRSEGITGINDKTLTMTGLNANDSGWYKVRVYEDCGSFKFSDSFYLGIHGLPKIIEEPISLTGNNTLQGDSVSFFVKAIGYDLTYRWFAGKDSLLDDSRHIGTDTDSLSIYSVQLKDVEFYYVIVKGGCGTVAAGNYADTSNLAVLEVETIPVITRQPPDTFEICENNSGNVILVAEGASLNYQWQKNGVDVFDGGSLSGTNTRILTISNAQPSDAGTYLCIVSNTSPYIAVSDPSVVIINPQPTKPVITQFGYLLQTDLDCESYTWYYNGTFQPQYSGQRNILPDKEGDWTVRVICKNCISPLSEPLAFFRGSILEQNHLPVTLYPNPATSQVTVELPEITLENQAMLQVYDMTGRLVMSRNNVISNSLDIDISALSSGMYAVSITTTEAMYSGKFIKE